MPAVTRRALFAPLLRAAKSAKSSNGRVIVQGTKRAPGRVKEAAKEAAGEVKTTRRTVLRSGAVKAARYGTQRLESANRKVKMSQRALSRLQDKKGLIAAGRRMMARSAVKSAKKRAVKEASNKARRRLGMGAKSKVGILERAGVKLMDKIPFT